jgi:hypothetical protein
MHWTEVADAAGESGVAGAVRHARRPRGTSGIVKPWVSGNKCGGAHTPWRSATAGTSRATPKVTTRAAVLPMFGRCGQPIIASAVQPRSAHRQNKAAAVNVAGSSDCTNFQELSARMAPPYRCCSGTRRRRADAWNDVPPDCCSGGARGTLTTHGCRGQRLCDLWM